MNCEHRITTLWFEVAPYYYGHLKNGWIDYIKNVMKAGKWCVKCGLPLDSSGKELWLG